MNKPANISTWEVEDALNSVFRYPGDYVSHENYYSMSKQLYEKMKNKQL